MLSYLEYIQTAEPAVYTLLVIFFRLVCVCVCVCVCVWGGLHVESKAFSLLECLLKKINNNKERYAWEEEKMAAFIRDRSFIFFAFSAICMNDILNENRHF